MHVCKLEKYIHILPSNGSTSNEGMRRVTSKNKIRLEMFQVNLAFENIKIYVVQRKYLEEICRQTSHFQIIKDIKNQLPI